MWSRFLLVFVILSVFTFTQKTYVPGFIALVEIIMQRVFWQFDFTISTFYYQIHFCNNNFTDQISTTCHIDNILIIIRNVLNIFLLIRFDETITYYFCLKDLEGYDSTCKRYLTILVINASVQKIHKVINCFHHFKKFSERIYS